MNNQTAYAKLTFAISTSIGQEQDIDHAVKSMDEISLGRIDGEIVTLKVIGQSVRWYDDSEIEGERFGTVTFFVSSEFECESSELELAAYYLLNDLSVHDELYLEYPDGMPIMIETHNIEIEWHTKPIIGIA
ncbi:hypothetical protein ACFSO0_09575 [Brevibacillus sp. GCM10020057]|uniref:hypothetical protein n=1 Tax=Brevibacillus sp. GCM10020057 TaxID=3317327 RepID=UPI00363DA05C